MIEKNTQKNNEHEQTSNDWIIITTQNLGFVLWEYADELITRCPD
jgi:hypothetical protein